MIERNCKTCGRGFLTYPCNVAAGKAIYCSRKCVPVGLHSLAHGESQTRLYNIWSRMKARCNCKTSKAYHYYGARGITVFQEWAESFEAFRDWAIGNGYGDKLELDRRNTNGNYEPGNCRWATRIQQMRNTRKRCGTTTSRFKGVSWCANAGNGGRWRVQIHRDKSPVHIGLFDDEIEAAKAYDRAARRMYGEFALLNFQQGGAIS